MNALHLKRLLALSLLLSPAFVYADVVNGDNPSYVKVKVYEVRVFTDANCSGSGITIFQTNSPSLTDMANNPTLGSGAIPNGTYRCIGMKMSDNIHYALASNSPHNACVASTDYISDVAHDDTAIAPDGSTQVLGPRGTEDTVWLYIREGGSNTNGSSQHSWQPTGGIPLTSPLVVSGDQSRTMVFDFDGKVGDEDDGLGGWQCGCDAPTMSFR
jgi:hypothetical protein